MHSTIICSTAIEIYSRRIRHEHARLHFPMKWQPPLCIVNSRLELWTLGTLALALALALHHGKEWNN